MMAGRTRIGPCVARWGAVLSRGIGLDMHQHPPHQTHGAVIKRLKRAIGHLSSIIPMIETGRPCLGLAQQLHAVENAIANAKKILIHDHIDHCLDTSMGSARSTTSRGSLREFKEITKYL